MKKIFKNEKGITLIAIVLITVLSVAAGGTTFLGVRALVTKEPFLQPFEDMGIIELEDEEKEDKKSEKKDDKNKDNEEEQDEVVDKSDEEDDDEASDDEVTITGEGEESSLLVEEINDEGVECYTIVVDLKEVADGIVPIVEDLLNMYLFTGIDGTTTEEGEAMGDIFSTALEVIPKIFVDCEIIIDCYANGNDIKQLLITVPYEQMIENFYSEMTEIETLISSLDPSYVSMGYTSYDECLADFEETVLSECTTENIRSMLSEEDVDSKYAEIINTAECVVEDGKIQISLNLSSISIDEYIGELKDQFEEMGIDSDNLVESVVDTWISYIDEVGYNGAIEGVYSMIMGTYEMFSF